MNINISKSVIYAAVLMLTLSGCGFFTRTIVVPETLATYHAELRTDANAFISDGEGRVLFHNLTFRNEGVMPLYLNVRNELPAASLVTITFDPTVLDLPNPRNNDNHTLFPEQFVELANGGVLLLAANTIQSLPMNLRLTSDGSLDPNRSYVVPLRITVTSGDLRFTERDETKLVFVRDLTASPKTNHNPHGIVMISCYETNDTNPLNHLEFTLASTGELFFNTIIIFSANVNYNAETGRPFIRFNEHLGPQMDRFYHYFQPLRDAGARLILSILPHWDRVGLSNMTAETARAFAQEVLAVSDKWDFDGIMLDDEYMREYYIHNPAPGFLYPSQYNLARLALEIQKAQPHRVLMLYLFSDVGSNFRARTSPHWEGRNSNFPLPDIDGVKPGEFIDYALQDYNPNVGFPDQIRGLPPARQGWRSQEWVLPRNLANTQEQEDLLREMRDLGRLTHMIFGFDPNRGNWENYIWPSMQRTARAYFDDYVIDSGIRHSRDWVSDPQRRAR